MKKQGLKHLDNRASNHLSLAEEQSLLRIFFEERDLSDDDLEDSGDCAYCQRKPEKGV